MLRGNVDLVISVWSLRIGRLPWGIEPDPRAARDEGGGSRNRLDSAANWRRHAEETE
jgi:hypothetical protein